MTIFHDRRHAGIVLADFLKGVDFDVVAAIPRGGAIVAAEISRRSHKPLLIVGVRKIPIPWNPEAGFGAIAEDCSTYFNEKILKRIYISDEQIKELSDSVKKEVERRVKVYRDKEIPDLSGKRILLVDDGFATGYTAIAAIHLLKKKGAAKVYPVAPCSPKDTVDLLKTYADDVFVINIQRHYPFAVASYYEDFSELSDEDVLKAIAGVEVA